MTDEQKINVKEKIKAYLLNESRISNLIAFMFGFIIAHCTDFYCVTDCLKSIFN
jgi:hypothetical protein